LSFTLIEVTFGNVKMAFFGPVEMKSIYPAELQLVVAESVGNIASTLCTSGANSDRDRGSSRIGQAYRLDRQKRDSTQKRGSTAR
jgi:hypothetical protein